jgi:hypothetical protein
MKAEGDDDLSRSAAQARRASESTAAVRRIVTSEAELLDEPISLHLSATADNTLVPRFFALYSEPLAEGAAALAQPDWGRSHCRTAIHTTVTVSSLSRSRREAFWRRLWPRRALMASMA